MESKNLKIIQKIAHVLEILYRIAYVFCIIGLVCTIIGAVAVIVCKNIPSAAAAIDQHADLNITQLIVVCCMGFIDCLCGIVPLKLTLNWLKKEQEAGTPFTMEGAGSLKQLGIVYIVTPLVIAIVSAILCAAFDLPDSVQLSSDASVGTGILLILLSFVFGYGAELEAKVKEN